MPALPNVSKVMRVDLFFTWAANARVRDRIFFQFAGAGPVVADLNTLITTISNAWGTNMSARQGTNCTLTAVEITDLTSATGAQSIQSVSKAGTDATASNVLGSAFVIKFKIARRYRGGHPRFYLPGGTSGQLSGPNQVSAAAQSAIATAFGNFISASETTPPANVGAMTHVNVSYFLGFTNKTFPSGRTRPVPTLRGTPLVDAISTYSTNPLVASQRRRNLQSA